MKYFLLYALVIISSVCTQVKSHSAKNSIVNTEYGDMEYSCPPGYYESPAPRGIKCSRDVRQPAKEMCDIGEKEGNRCVKYVPMRQECPTGYTNTCANMIVKKKFFTKHHKNNKCRCVKPETIPSIPRCSDGTLNVSYCEKILAVPIKYECPRGYEQRGTGSKMTCSKSDSTQPIAFCPEGTTKENKRCVSYHPAPVTYECPRYTECKRGHNGECEQCISVDEVEPKCSCPHGTMYEDDGCKKEETFDCSEKEVYGHRTHGRHTGHGNHRHLVGKPNFDLCDLDEDGVCKQGSTSESVEVISKMCKRIKTIPQSCVCPHGYTQKLEFIGGETKCGMCVKTTYTPPNAVCLAEGDAQDCYTKTYVDLSHRCPENYVQDKSKHSHKLGHFGSTLSCINVEYVNPVPYCPASGSPSNCHRVEHVEPNQICPDGATKLFDGTCQAMVYVDLHNICPEDYIKTNNNQCAQYSKTSFTCVFEGPNFELEGDMCVATEYVKPTCLQTVVITKTCEGVGCSKKGL